MRSGPRLAWIDPSQYKRTLTPSYVYRASNLRHLKKTREDFFDAI